MVTETSSTLSPLWSRLARSVARAGMSRRLAVALTVAALASGAGTYGALTGSGPFGPDPVTVRILLFVDLVLVLLLSVVVVLRLVRLWLERRRGLAGARLHIRLVTLFSVVAVAPALMVTLFSLLYLNFGIESWFSERIRTAIDGSLAVAEAYLDEHRKVIGADALALANDVNRSRAALIDNSARFNRFLATQAALRGLTEIMVFRRDGRVLGRTGLTFSLLFEPLPWESMEKANSGEVVIITTENDDRVRALVRLGAYVNTYLFVGRFIDPRAIGYMERTQSAVSEYERLQGERLEIQTTFTLIFGVVMLLLLLAAVWVGLNFATQIVRPISNLVAAAERVRSGDLTVRVAEGPADDEIGILSRGFNRMTDEVENQRRELIEANRQLDARRRFTESVLSGVSAGVIGLDSQGRIELPNRSALVLLSSRADEWIGRKLADAVPEMGALMEKALQRPERGAQAKNMVVRGRRTRTLLVRIGAERLGAELEGFVVTFDDITELLAAQRTAAWADVARRIAHEIKNPLTPIQLSAERIKRKYGKEIKSDPEVFNTCTDTIVRQVGDIRRMVDEFSAFARMPAPAFNSEELVGLVRQAIDLMEVAHPGIEFVENFPDAPVMLRCDGRQIVQMLANVLRNAVESIEDRKPSGDGELEVGKVRMNIDATGEQVIIEVHDNGSGLPVEMRDRLVEPYVTTRSKGTGLGLAIVKKIMEDHSGELVLEDGSDGGACVRLVFDVSAHKPATSSTASRSRKVVSHDA